MTQFLDFFLKMWNDILAVLSSVKFDLYGYPVDLVSILFVIIFIGLVISIFWRGSKT